MLLEAGADPTATDEHGKALLTMAHEAQQPKITALLEARLRGVPELPGLPPLHWLRNRAGSATLEGGVLTMVAGKQTDWFNPPSDPASPARIPPLYLPCISLISPVYLLGEPRGARQRARPYTSTISHLYLPYISPISPLYIS